MAGLGPFEMTIRLQKGMAGTFFGYEQFTVPGAVRRGWTNLDACQLYGFRVGDGVRDRYRGTRLEPVLEAMEAPGICPMLKIDFNAGDSQLQFRLNPEGGVDVTSRNYVCLISHLLFQQFQLLFFASQVYYRMGRPLPDPPESFTLRFDPEEKTALLTQAEVFLPQDPFLEYAREMARSQSAAAVLPETPGDRAENFYGPDACHGWMETRALDGISPDVPKVVYMLYDARQRTFYVGKADWLVKRLRQHQEDPRDPIPGFTHFRYSCVPPAHWKDIYLIENAAIHDCAWLLEMPLARTYRPSLEDCLRRGDIPGGLGPIRMVNSMERQTR